jgi:hypothetical protein
VRDYSFGTSGAALTGNSSNGVVDEFMGIPISRGGSTGGTRLWTTMGQGPATRREFSGKANGDGGGEAAEEGKKKKTTEEGKQKKNLLSLEDLLGQLEGKSRVAGDAAAATPIDLSPLMETKTQRTLLPEGLPKGLKLELSHGPQVLCRSETRSFLKSVLNEEEEEEGGLAKKHFVDGFTGTGKSVALALLVALARMKGWLVVYLPSASALLAGGRYKYNEESDLWDTTDVAEQILNNFAQAHAHQMEDLPRLAKLLPPTAAGDSKTTNSKSSSAATAADDHEDSVQNVLDLLKGLASQDKHPLLICTDDYNALFGQTKYFDYTDRPLAPHDLRLVCAFRWLERPEIVRGTIVASASASVPVSKTIKVPKTGEVKDVNLSPFSYEEACMAWSKHGQEQPSKRSQEEQILKNFVAGVSGNGHAIRDFSALL